MDVVTHVFFVDADPLKAVAAEPLPISRFFNRKSSRSTPFLQKPNAQEGSLFPGFFNGLCTGARFDCFSFFVRCRLIKGICRST